MASPELVPLLPVLREHSLRRQRVLHAESIAARRAVVARSGTALADGSRVEDTVAHVERTLQRAREREREQLAFLWCEISRLCGDDHRSSGHHPGSVRPR